MMCWGRRAAIRDFEKLRGDIWTLVGEFGL